MERLGYRQQPATPDTHFFRSFRLYGEHFARRSQ
ncbi:hypothetical protein C8E08_1659 [Paracidovorax citrulli]|nr:hypothetical protein C8E08_1659 [Paracidovorax citrulli]REG71455.1 hypothetical protein C8E07_4708 [Paracidovorax citrulli]RLJ96008.1 hypothetical protein C8E06_4703 [Paracidovorax citrulli]